MTSEPSMLPLVIVLLGPTASGKTALSLKLAKELNLSVLNIDSRQLYTGMDIGTSKPTKQEQLQIPHYLLDLRPPDRPITLQEFKLKALTSIHQSFNSRGIAFLVGGSGLYLKALISGYCPPKVSPQVELRSQLGLLGQKTCHSLLKEADPIAASSISPADSVRTKRALEVLYATGKPISTQRRFSPPPWHVIDLGLDPFDLRQRIAERTKQLYRNGLINETEKLIKRFSEDLPLLQTIGYREALQVLQGHLKEPQAVSLTTIRTQQFAKRQRTWFRKQHNPCWLNDQEPFSEAMSIIQAGLGCTEQA